MDGLLRLLWPAASQTGPAMAIPTYRQGDGEDPIDLQVRSLLYMFRRCDIAHLQPFRTDKLLGPADGSGARAARAHKYDKYAKRSTTSSTGPDKSTPTADANAKDAHSRGISQLDQEKLDIMYNKSGFERALAADEHRILVDWAKNKFRAMCVLSAMPQEMDRLPSFGRNSKGFRFIVLPADASDDEYMSVLAESDIYCEHSVPAVVRRRLVLDGIELARNSRAPGEAVPAAGGRALSKNDRAFIIQHYLQQMAVEVQVARLYKASATSGGVPAATSPSGSPSASPLASPLAMSPTASPRAFASSEPAPAAPKLQASGTPALGPHISVRKQSRGSHGSTSSPSPPSSPISRPTHSQSPSPHRSASGVPMPPRSPSPVRGLAIGSPSSPPRGRSLRPQHSTSSLNAAFRAMPELSPVKGRSRSASRSPDRSPSPGTTMTTPAESDDTTPAGDSSRSPSPSTRDLLKQVRVAVKNRLERERALLLLQKGQLAGQHA